MLIPTSRAHGFRQRASRLLFVLALVGPSSPAHADAPPCPARTGSGKTIVVDAGGHGAFRQIQQGLDAAMPGDIVLVKKGTYPGELKVIRGGAASGCLWLKGEPGAEVAQGNFGLLIESRNYVRVSDLTFRNFKRGSLPAGIVVRGSASNIELSRNVVANVENNQQGHGISIEGTGGAPINNILIDGNEVHHCLLGQSESLVLNGNVTNFVVSNNKIHDNNNIGIDIAGHFGLNKDANLDQARGGKVTGNIISHISALHNPAYLENGVQAATADGIYVDGGASVVIENNQVSNCDIGIEVSSEVPGQLGQQVIVRNNRITGSRWGNIHVGGEDSEKNGGVTQVTIEQNQLSAAGFTQILFQNHINGALLRGNVFSPAASAGIWAAGRSGARNVQTDTPITATLPRDLVPTNLPASQMEQVKAEFRATHGSRAPGFYQLQDPPAR